MDVYKSVNVKITIGTVVKNPNMLKFVSDHCKTNKMCKHAVKKLPSIIRYGLEQYKTKQMCNKVILENGEKLESVSDCYKNQKICDKAVDNYIMHSNLSLIFA